MTIFSNFTSKTTTSQFVTVNASSTETKFDTSVLETKDDDKFLGGCTLKVDVASQEAQLKYGLHPFPWRVRWYSPLAERNEEGVNKNGKIHVSFRTEYDDACVYLRLISKLHQGAYVNVSPDYIKCDGEHDILNLRSVTGLVKVSKHNTAKNPRLKGESTHTYTGTFNEEAVTLTSVAGLDLLQAYYDGASWVVVEPLANSLRVVSVCTDSQLLMYEFLMKIISSKKDVFLMDFARLTFNPDKVRNAAQDPDRVQYLWTDPKTGNVGYAWSMLYNGKILAGLKLNPEESKAAAKTAAFNARQAAAEEAQVQRVLKTGAVLPTDLSGTLLALEPTWVTTPTGVKMTTNYANAINAQGQLDLSVLMTNGKPVSFTKFNVGNHEKVGASLFVDPNDEAGCKKAQAVIVGFAGNHTWAFQVAG